MTRLLTSLATVIVIVGLVFLPFVKQKDRVKRGSISSSSWHDPTRSWTIFRDALTLVTYLLVLSILFSPSLLSDTFLTLDFSGNTLVQILVLVIVALGAMLGGWALRTLGRFATEKIGMQKDHQLVQSGPYRLVTHPIYGAALLIGLGFFLLLLNLLLLILTVAVFLVNVYRARVEEALLSSPEGFGQQYSEYRMRTRRFIPYVF